MEIGGFETVRDEVREELRNGIERKREIRSVEFGPSLICSSSPNLHFHYFLSFFPLNLDSSHVSISIFFSKDGGFELCDLSN